MLLFSTEYTKPNNTFQINLIYVTVSFKCGMYTKKIFPSHQEAVFYSAVIYCSNSTVIYKHSNFKVQADNKNLFFFSRSENIAKYQVLSKRRLLFFSFSKKGKLREIICSWETFRAYSGMSPDSLSNKPQSQEPALSPQKYLTAVAYSLVQF